MKANYKKIMILCLFAVIILLVFTGCANKEDIEPCLKGRRFGFLWGLWHGFIAPFNLIGMLFRTDITIYAQNNTGAWYGLGFLIGSGGWGFFGGKKMFRSRKKEN